MHTYKHAIGGHVQIRFENIRAFIKGTLEGCEGVFRAGGRIAAMGHHIGLVPPR
jgi:hypothetical protein